MKVRRISNHVYLNTMNQQGGAFPIYKGRRRLMMRGGRFGFLLNIGKKLLGPIGKTIGKTLLSSAKKKVVPIIAERGSQVLSGGLTPKQAIKAAMKDSAKAMLGSTREVIENELLNSMKKKQRGRGLMQRSKKSKYKKH